MRHDSPPKFEPAFQVQGGTKPIWECHDVEPEANIRQSNEILLGGSTIFVGVKRLNWDENEGVEDADARSSCQRTMLVFIAEYE